MAPVVVNQIIRHLSNSTIVSIPYSPESSITTPSSTLTTSVESMPTTVTAFEIIPSSTPTPSMKIPNWTYAFITLLVICIAPLLLMIFKGFSMVVRRIKDSWNGKQELAMRSEMEDGRRRKLEEALGNLEGKRKNGLEMECIDEAWEEILREVEVELNAFNSWSSSGSQPQDWDKYASGVLKAKFKALDSTMLVLGEISSPKSVVSLEP